MHEGHRMRMMQRARTELGTLQDHELLEILLYNVIPRANTNPVAHKLIEAFGSLGGVFSASHEQLVGVEGVGAATATYLKCIGNAIGRVSAIDTRIRTDDDRHYYNLRAFSEFLKDRFPDRKLEAMELYCLDGAGKVYFVKGFSTEQLDEVSVRPEEIGRILVTETPVAVVVAHNHPKTTAAPSAADNAFTVRMLLLCSLHNVHFYDHIILGKDDSTFSYFVSGKLAEYRLSYDIDAILDERRIP